MSFGEFLLIGLLSIVILQPKDFKILGKAVRKMIIYINNVKSSLINALEDEPENIEESERKIINDYLAKIIELSGKYEGEYDLKSVKSYYHKILMSKNSHKNNIPS